ncbi:NAD(P)-binding protein [Meredithblackwellia eburnea MCA 4105]
MKAIILQKTEGDFKPGKVYHQVPLVQVPIPTPGPDQVLVKIQASAFNHRDVFVRQSMYPGIIFSTPDKPSIMGADAAGILVSPGHPLSNKAVLVHSAVGWKSDPSAPEGAFGILGSTAPTQGRGTFAEYIVVGKDDVFECPEHFLGRGVEGWAEAAAVPLGGLTAYRAVFTKANVQSGQNILVTGIGGGVAIAALQYAVAAGANVWVSSSSEEKIEKAVKLGAKGGVNYKDAQWAKTLSTLLPKSRPYLDAVIDSGGGAIVSQTVKLLKAGGVVSCYGMTAGGDVAFPMTAVLKNIEFRGSTMGSLAEMKKAVEFIAKHKIRPVIHTVLDGLENAEEGFQTMKDGKQFGKITIAVVKDDKRKL